MFAQFISSHLDLLFKWFTALAIILPILGGFAGWGAWTLSDRIAERDATQSRTALESTRTELLEARKQADEARRLATEIEERQRPRTVTDEQRRIIREALAAADRSKATVHVCTTVQGDSDQYGRELYRALNEAGVAVTYGMALTEFPAGVTINPVHDSTPSIVAPIIDALSKAGITVAIYHARKEDTPDNSVGIMIGRKK